MSYLFAILLFSFLIFIHELGHFMAAKLFGVQVNEFRLLMGPVLFQKQIGKTVYSVRCIPIGGFCAMEGEDGEGQTDNPGAFPNAAWWKRCVILVAGAAMNLVAGAVLLLAFFAPDKQFVVPVVSEVDPKCSFAGEAGIREGDRILRVDGEKVYVMSDFSMLLSLNPGDVHDLEVLRDGKKLELNRLNMQKQDFENEDGTVSRRYGFSFTVIDASLWETLRYTALNVADCVRLVRLSLQMLITGKAGVQDVSGPVGIVQQMATVADASGSAYYAFLNLLYFGGFIAINLAVMNLLPIPALDGGRVVGVLLTALIEGITKKKLNPRIEGYIHGAGMVLLMILMVLLLFKDLFFVIKR